MSRHRKTKLVRLFDMLAGGSWRPDDGWDNARIKKNCELVADQGGFSSKVLPLACVAVELLAQRQPDTVRGIMYACVSAGWLSDTSRQSYGRVQRVLDTLRKREVIPFCWIVDNVRSTEKPSSWSGLADFADTVANAYRRDFWASLPDYVCLVVEKDTVAGRVSPVTREYDVPLHPLRGFSSTSFAFAIAEEWREIEKPIYAFYIGDHDPSGRDIERSIRQRLGELARKEFHWRRLAVEPEHFQQFHIIPLEPKRRDTRYLRFAREYGDPCAEVEAVPADTLRGMVEGAIKAHIPSEQWARLQEIETVEKRQWHEVMGRLQEATAQGSRKGGAKP